MVDDTPYVLFMSGRFVLLVCCTTCSSLLLGPSYFGML